MDYGMDKPTERDYIATSIFILVILNEYMFKIDFIGYIEKDIFGFITLVVALLIWYLNYYLEKKRNEIIKKKNEKIKKSLLIYELDCNLDFIYGDIYEIEKQNRVIPSSLLNNEVFLSVLNSHKIVELCEQPVIQLLLLFNNRVKMINNLIEGRNHNSSSFLLSVLKDTYKRLKEIYTESGLIEQWKELDKIAQKKYKYVVKIS